MGGSERESAGILRRSDSGVSTGIRRDNTKIIDAMTHKNKKEMISEMLNYGQKPWCFMLLILRIVLISFIIAWLVVIIQCWINHDMTYTPAPSHPPS